MRWLVLCALAACSRNAQPPASEPTPRHVRLELAEAGLVVEWRTTAAVTTTGLIRFAAGVGLAPEQLDVRREGGESVEIRGDEVIRRARLTDLAPDTAYTYQVGAVTPDGVTYLSLPYTFRTAPDGDVRPDAEIVVGVLCRGGVELDVWQQLVEQVEVRVPDLVVFPCEPCDEDSDPAQHLLATVPGLHAGSGVRRFGFAEVGARAGAVTVHSTASAGVRTVVDLRALQRDAAAAFVRVRRDQLAVDAFGSDGVSLPASRVIASQARRARSR